MITKTPIHGVPWNVLSIPNRWLNYSFENAFNEEFHMWLLSVNMLSPFKILTWISSLKIIFFIMYNICLGGFDLSSGTFFFSCSKFGHRFHLDLMFKVLWSNEVLIIITIIILFNIFCFRGVETLFSNTPKVKNEARCRCTFFFLLYFFNSFSQNNCIKSGDKWKKMF